MQVREDKARKPLHKSRSWGKEKQDSWFIPMTTLQLTSRTQKGKHCWKQNHKKETRSHSSRRILPRSSFCDGSRQKPASGKQVSDLCSTEEVKRHMMPGRRDTAPQQQHPAVLFYWYIDIYHWSGIIDTRTPLFILVAAPSICSTQTKANPFAKD